MLVNFNFKLKKIDGANVEIDTDKKEKTINQIIGEALLNPNFKKGDLIKKYNLGTNIYQNGEIEIDLGDLKLVKESIEAEGHGIYPIYQAQILIEINKIIAQDNG